VKAKVRQLTNVTVTLDEGTLEDARVKAAEKGLSLSRFVGEVLRDYIGKDKEYWAAYRAWREEKPFPLKGPRERYPTREELYDRPVLRRR
jgi:hypothetical protein